MEKTIFEKIIDREVRAQFVYEDEVCVAILDKFPVVPGQTLIIPKKAVDYAFDLDDETYLHLCAVAKKVARALDTTFATLRTCMVIEGLEVPHVHIKLYPITKPELDIHDGKEESDEVLDQVAEQIKKAIG